MITAPAVLQLVEQGKAQLTQISMSKNLTVVSQHREPTAAALC